MAISRPFEIRIDRFEGDDGKTDSGGLTRDAVEEALLPIVRDCFDRDPDIAPSTANEKYGALVERDGKYARRVVYAVTQM
jgi:phosphatidylethanolamine N-methyltransferase